MTFDYFNTSHLAFGSKITRAFNQLNKLTNEGQAKIDELLAIYELYNQFIDRNYPAPFPSRPDAPVRAKELFDIMNDGNSIRTIYLDEEEDELHVKVTLFNRLTNRFTVGEGTTDLKSGYAFCSSSISNASPNREINFAEEYSDGHGRFLFQFRVDGNNNINIVGDESYNYFIPSNFDHIKDLEKGPTVLTSSRIDGTGYKAEDYEAILVVGYSYNQDSDNPRKGESKSDLRVKVNDVEYVDCAGWYNRQYVVVYLKPGDVLKASCKTAFKVIYTGNEPTQPTPPDPPDPPEPETPLEIESYGKMDAYVDIHDNVIWNSTETEITPSGNVVYCSSQSYPLGARVRMVLNFNRVVSGTDNKMLLFGYLKNDSGPAELGFTVQCLTANDSVLSTKTYSSTTGDTTVNVKIPLAENTTKVWITNNRQYLSGGRYTSSMSVAVPSITEQEGN